MGPRTDVKPIADELARRILVGEDDERLQWLKGSRDKVKVLSGSIVGGVHQKTSSAGEK